MGTSPGSQTQKSSFLSLMCTYHSASCGSPHLPRLPCLDGSTAARLPATMPPPPLGFWYRAPRQRLRCCGVLSPAQICARGGSAASQSPDRPTWARHPQLYLPPETPDPLWAGQLSPQPSLFVPPPSGPLHLGLTSVGSVAWCGFMSAVSRRILYLVPGNGCGG
eukprot:EG_transcript_27519